MHKLSVMLAGFSLAMLAGTAAAESHKVELKASDRKSLTLAVYSGFAVVRDLRKASLPKGTIGMKVLDIPRTIDPSSVQVGSSVGNFDLERQVYGYDLQDRQSLLRRYIGHDVTYRQVVRHNGSDETLDRLGKLLSVNPEIVRFSDGIEVSPTGVLSLAPLPGLRTSPTLTWQADVGVGGPQVIETTYIADGISWLADYRLNLNAGETSGDLSVWAQVSNNSGLAFDQARVRLVSGDVNRTGYQVTSRQVAALARMESAAPTPRSFSDYYVYPVTGRFDLAADRMLHIKLISARSIAVDKSYRLVNGWQPQPMPEPIKARPDIRYTFKNSQKAGLGAALPPGIVRIFKRDGEVSELLGEDNIRRISKGDDVTVTAGQSSDIDVTHTQTEFHRTAAETDIGFKVQVHNHKSHKVQVTLDEKFYGDWQVTAQSLRGERVDSGTQRYVVSVAAGEEKAFDFAVRYNTKRQLLH